MSINKVHTLAQMICSCWRDMAGALHVTLLPVIEVKDQQILDTTENPGAVVKIVIPAGSDVQQFFQIGTTYSVDISKVEEAAQRAPEIRPMATDAAMKHLRDTLSVAVGSSRTVPVSGLTACDPKTDAVVAVTGEMKGTRNAQGGIDYEISVDPITLGVEAPEVGGD